MAILNQATAREPDKSGKTSKKGTPRPLAGKAAILIFNKECDKSSKIRAKVARFGGRFCLRSAIAIWTMRQAVLYTRQGCHLCEEALAVLKRHGLSPRLIDIDAEPALQERYNECVPVVEIDGKERFRGRINEVLLARILAARQ